MPNDMYTLKALADELALNLIGGKIEKINQPEKDEVIFYVHKNKTNILVISVNANCPRIHITDEKKDNPYVAPAFLMLLRKRMQGARIENVALVGYDRIIKIDFKGRNEMSDEIANTLYIELLGRYSNIILCDENEIIIEALRHIYPENSFRCVLPKVKYELPPNDKLKPDEKEKIISSLSENDVLPILKIITSKISGFSSATARELLYRLDIDENQVNVSRENAVKIADAVFNLYNISKLTQYSPCYRLNDKGEDFFVFPYTHTKEQFTKTDTLNEAVAVCSLERDRKTRLLSESKLVANAIKNAIKKNENALAIAKQKVFDSKEYEKTRIIGELITNNIYQIQKGANFVELHNYYDDSVLKINLDPQKTPAQNAQAYYKKYSKAKRTVSIATEQIKQAEKKLEYLYSLKSCLELCYLPQEIEGIKQEAINFGILEVNTKKSDKIKKTLALPPKEYLYNGFKIYRGRNNIDNENITFNISKDEDIWLHVKDLHGSHVLIKSDGKKIPNDVIQIAAEIAGYYSEGKQSYKVSVDYCFKKHVKKNPSGVKGAVLYTNYKTAYISPKQHLESETNK